MRLASPFGNPEFRRFSAAVLASCLLHLVLVAAFIPNLDDFVLANTDTDLPIVLKARLEVDKNVSSGVTMPKLDLAQRQEPVPPSEPASEFSPAQQLSKRPRVIGTVDLDIPESNLLTEAGTMVLKLWIGPMGRVEKVEVDKSSLPKAFADAAAEVFHRTRFEPGEIDGRAVGSILMIEISHPADSERDAESGAEPSQ